MLMRFTVIGEDRSISFIGPGHLLKMITAVVSTGCRCLPEVLRELESLDDQFVATLRRDLSVFDEYCLAGDEDLTRSWFGGQLEGETRAFRIIDHVTRKRSTEVDGLGLAIFNLNERRIVQVQNSYGDLLRQDRGRLRRGGKPTATYYSYNLPQWWAIVP